MAGTIDLFVSFEGKIGNGVGDLKGPKGDMSGHKSSFESETETTDAGVGAEIVF